MRKVHECATVHAGNVTCIRCKVQGLSRENDLLLELNQILEHSRCVARSGAPTSDRHSTTAASAGGVVCRTSCVYGDLALAATAGWAASGDEASAFLCVAFLQHTAYETCVVRASGAVAL